MIILIIYFSIALYSCVYTRLILMESWSDSIFGGIIWPLCYYVHIKSIIKWIIKLFKKV